MKVDAETGRTIITLVIVVFWIGTAITRLWMPWPQAAALDAAMPVMIGYWFVGNAGSKKDSL